jgi:conjugative transfer region lipoprotein (TIGR03751 family)
MKIPITLMLSAALISLNACSSMTGNVVPKSGPAMEKVYDSMGQQNNNNNHELDEENKSDYPESIKQFREEKKFKNNVSASTDLHKFHKLPNPELQLYIYPHLAGRDQIPVPGYTTVFNAYDRDHYAL